MPGSVRKRDAAFRIALDLLGPPPSGLTDEHGKKKRYIQKKEATVVGEESRNEEEGYNRFEDIGYR